MSIDTLLPLWHHSSRRGRSGGPRRAPGEARGRGGPPRAAHAPRSLREQGRDRASRLASGMVSAEGGEAPVWSGHLSRSVLLRRRLGSRVPSSAPRKVRAPRSGTRRSVGRFTGRAAEGRSQSSAAPPLGGPPRAGRSPLGPPASGGRPRTRSRARGAWTGRSGPRGRERASPTESRFRRERPTRSPWEGPRRRPARAPRRTLRTSRTARGRPGSKARHTRTSPPGGRRPRGERDGGDREA